MSALTRPSRETSRWRRIVLPVSLILNLFLMALIGGHVWRARSDDMRSEPLVRALARAEASLPPKDAAAFGAVIRREELHFAEAQKQLAAARQNVRRQVTAEHFDQAAVRRALVTWQAAWNDFFDDFSGTLVDALAQVSPEGRRKLIAARQSESRSTASP